MQRRQWHRRLGWVAGLVAVAWAATGFLHPIMSWTAPRAAVQAPPVQVLAADDLVAPGPALLAAGLAESKLVRLVDVGGDPIWMAARADGGRRVALDARSGAPAPEAEQAHAVALARHYSDLPTAEVESVRLIERFSTNYPSVNKLLPVWEVRFAGHDGLTLYVDTGLDRLAQVTNDLRRVLLTVFQNVHTLKFLEFFEPLRVAVLFALIATVVATTAIGATMLFSARGRGVRRIHTVIAWIALPLVGMFTLSGLLHLVVTSDLAAAPPPQAKRFAIAALSAPPSAERLQHLTATADISGAPLWRMQTDEAVRYFGADAPANDGDRARRLAGVAPEAMVTAVDRFGGAYGFINKRLPVAQVETPQGPVFVDYREGLIVAGGSQSSLERIEGWSFDMLHKWQFLNPIGKRNRDYATMAAAALVFLTGVFGLVLLVRRR